MTEKDKRTEFIKDSVADHIKELYYNNLEHLQMIQQQNRILISILTYLADEATIERDSIAFRKMLETLLDEKTLNGENNGTEKEENSSI